MPLSYPYLSSLCYLVTTSCGLPWWLSGKESVCQCRRGDFDPWVGKIPWRRKWQPISVFLPGKTHGQRSLVGYSPWGSQELGMTQQLTSRVMLLDRVYKPAMILFAKCIMENVRSLKDLKGPFFPSTIYLLKDGSCRLQGA